MKRTQIDRPAGFKGRRGIVLIVAAVLALGIGVTGVQALAGGSASPQASPEPRATVTPPRQGAPGAVTHPVPVVTTQEPAPDPNALADGVYPTYVRAVDVQGATITVDVLQTFFGEDAHQAAIEDGVSWKDVQYSPVYIRNENPLLRTLPVARDAHIKMMGVCEAPSRWIGLTQLRGEIDTNPPDIYYYEVTMADGTVVGILQKLAVSAC